MNQTKPPYKKKATSGVGRLFEATFVGHPQYSAKVHVIETSGSRHPATAHIFCGGRHIGMTMCFIEGELPTENAGGRPPEMETHVAVALYLELLLARKFKKTHAYEEITRVWESLGRKGVGDGSAIRKKIKKAREHFGDGDKFVLETEYPGVIWFEKNTKFTLYANELLANGAMWVWMEGDATARFIPKTLARFTGSFDIETLKKYYWWAHNKPTGMNRP